MNCTIQPSPNPTKQPTCISNSNENNNNSSSKNNNKIISSGTKSKSESKPKINATLLIVISYLTGLLWISLHPILSITTGELKCRGVYIDENALSIKSFRTARYDSIRKESVRPVSSSKRRVEQNKMGLCDVLHHEGNTVHGVDCLRHVVSDDGSFGLDIARAVPGSSRSEPTESVAVIANAPSMKSNGWTESDYHLSLLAMLQRLGDPTVSPWLAKTIFVISPWCVSGSMDHDCTAKMDLENVADVFYEAYNGAGKDGHRPLPPSHTHTILRNVIVTNVTATSTPFSTPNQRAALRILPMGSKGVLPNLDFVSAVLTMFEKGSWVGDTVRLHSYEKVSRYWEDAGRAWLPRQMWKYAKDMIGMTAFAANLMLGPYPPHDIFLQNGIDSLTIQATLFPFNAPNHASLDRTSADFVQQLEHTLRGLSNLHERLHHSVYQYLLPSSTTFVSNGEYTFPCVLLILPMAIRAYFLLFRDMQGYCLNSATKTAVIAWGVLALFMYAGVMILPDADADAHLTTLIFVVAYVVSFLILRRTVYCNSERKPREIVTSIQCMACCLSVYIHVPIMLTNFSLAAPSTMIWTVLLSFNDFNRHANSQANRFPKIRKYVKITAVAAIWFLTWPPVLIVPHVFGRYDDSVYLNLVYVPLHFMFSAMIYGSWLCDDDKKKI